MASRAPPLEDDPWIDEPSEGGYEPPTETDETGSDTDLEEAYEEALEEAILNGEDDEEEEDGEDDEEDEADGDAMTVDDLRRLIQESVEDTEAPTEPAAAATITPAAQPVQNNPQRIARTNALLELFRQGSFTRLLAGPRGLYVAADDDDDDDEPYGRVRRRRRVPKPKRRMSDLYPVPSRKGLELMESGVFGVNERDTGQYIRKKKMAARIMRRELGLGSPGKERATRRLVSQSLIPESKADSIVHYESRCYSGKFSDDGNFFYSCSQDFRVRMYDTSNPYTWRYYKTVLYPYGQWTITDASLSPDNKWLAYSSIRSIVCLANTDPEPSEPHLLDFSDVGRGTGRRGGGHFGIWSLRFSGDGREIVAGTSDQSVYVYDLESRQSILRIPGHDDDVNAVCYGDQSSPHILYSGSDDTTIKVWDRRSLGDSREAGVFLGHTEGLTYIDSKGDGRYVLSNGKDQSMKLWDLRKMHSTEDAAQAHTTNYATGFDYRFQAFDEREFEPHPQDCSLVTFRGHQVLKTLIRCHFSPPGSTDSRYVYTGSADGKVYVYNIDGTIASKLDVEETTRNTRPRTGDEEYDMDALYEDRRGGGDWKTCVRDASWHPNAPVIAATSWNGYGMNKGTCTVHTWNDGLEEDEGSPAMGNRVNAQLGRETRFYEAERDRRGQIGQRNAFLRARRMLPDDDD